MPIILSKRPGGSGGGGAPSGPAGGSLTGTYPNPGIANNAVDTAQIADGAVTDNKIDSEGATLGYTLASDGANGAAWVRADWDAQVVKPSDQTVNASTVLVNDTAIQVAISANVTYLYELYLKYLGDGNGDIKFAWALASGAFTGGIRLAQGVSTSDTGLNAHTLDNTTAIGFGSSPTQVRVGTVFGFVTADTSTTLRLQWAQNGASGSTTLQAGTFLRYRAVVA